MISQFILSVGLGLGFDGLRIPQTISAITLLKSNENYKTKIWSAAHEILKPRDQHTKALQEMAALLRGTIAEFFLITDSNHRSFTMRKAVANKAFSEALQSMNVKIYAVECSLDFQPLIDKRTRDFRNIFGLGAPYFYRHSRLFASGLARAKSFDHLRNAGIRVVAIDKAGLFHRSDDRTNLAVLDSYTAGVLPHRKKAILYGEAHFTSKNPNNFVGLLKDKALVIRFELGLFNSIARRIFMRSPPEGDILVNLKHGTARWVKGSSFAPQS